MSTHRLPRASEPSWGLALTMICLSFVATIAAVMVWRGWSFYSLGLDARVDHPDYRVLSPSSRLGRTYGEIGGALVFVNLFYLVRRRLAARRLGSMKAWLNLHVLTGVVASLFVLFHSAFQLRTPLATATSVSMALVVVTGIVGRFLYAMAPRSGNELLARRLKALEAEAPGLGEWVEGRLRAIRVTRIEAEASLLTCLASLPAWAAQARARRKAVQMSLDGWAPLLALSPARRSALRKLGADAARLAAGQVRAVAAGTLLRSWRSMHRLFAILMLLSVVVHIGVALYYGYGWGAAE